MIFNWGGVGLCLIYRRFGLTLMRDMMLSLTSKTNWRMVTLLTDGALLATLCDSLKGDTCIISSAKSGCCVITGAAMRITDDLRFLLISSVTIENGAQLIVENLTLPIERIPVIRYLNSGYTMISDIVRIV